VRVLDKRTGYVKLRYTSNDPGQPLTLLPDGTAGQVELPPPPGGSYDPVTNPNGFGLPNKANVWDTIDFVIVADYSVLPQPVDQNGMSSGATIRPRFTPATPYVRGVGNVQNQVQ